MKNNKQRVCIAARKRGLTVNETRRLFRAFGCPPTVAEVPYTIGTIWLQNFYGEMVPFTDNKDRRDISRPMADALIREIDLFKDMVR